MQSDFPKSLLEFQRSFATEEACWKYLVQSRWPNGFVCPHDGKSSVGFITTRKLWQCPNGHQISATIGTTLHGTKIPLTKWFWAAYLVITHTPGLSAWQLHRQLNLNYETAYLMLKRLRAGMVHPSRSPLNGPVEIADFSIGGKKAVPSDRGTEGKAMIVGAVEIRKEGPCRIRLQKIPQVSSEELIRFIRKHIAPRATIITDSCRGYSSLRSLGYRHIVKKEETTKEAAKQLPHISRIFADLKTWLIGTHHGVSPKQLQTYLDEFSFRFNERRSPMEAFQTALRINPKVTQTAALETVHET